MTQFLIVMEAQSKAPMYAVLLDALERRLGARRILRTAWGDRGRASAHA